MADLITIARPYAKAAFEFAVEKNQVDEWQKALGFASEICLDEQIQSLLTSDMKPESLADLFIAICRDLLNEYSSNFIKIVAENQRLGLFPEIFTLFQQLYQEKEAIAEVEVISAAALNDEQINKISTAIEKRLSRKVNLTCHIDESMIAGFVIRTGDIVIDSSIRGRLNLLSDALQS